MADPELDLPTILATALCGLLDFVDHRPDDATADDDVKALEDAAYVLLQVAPEDRANLIELLGDRHAYEVGLIK